MYSVGQSNAERRGRVAIWESTGSYISLAISSKQPKFRTQTETTRLRDLSKLPVAKNKWGRGVKKYEIS